MSLFKNTHKFFIKLLWPLVFLLGLSGSFCDGQLNLNEGGISGTGISVGPITGFGSIYVDGKKYDTSNTQFYRNGELISEGQEGFKIGEIINLKTGVNKKTGKIVAIRVDFNSTAIGRLEKIKVDGKEQLKVLGYEIKTDALTMGYGVSNANDIPEGSIIELSGSEGADNQLLLSTFSLKNDKVTQASEIIRFKGYLEALNENTNSFKVRGVTVDYSQAELIGYVYRGMQNNDYISIAGKRNKSGLIMANSIQLLSKNSSYKVGELLTLQGLVAKLDMKQQTFVLNGMVMHLLDTTAFKEGDRSDFSLNDSIKVSGIVLEDQSLQVTSVYFMRQAGEYYVELEGSLSAVDIDNQQVTVLGQVFLGVNNKAVLLDRTLPNVETLSIDHLLVGDQVRIIARDFNDELKVVRLDRVHFDNYNDKTDDVKLKGIPDKLDVDNQSFKLLGIDIQLDDNIKIIGLEDKLEANNLQLNSTAIFALESELQEDYSKYKIQSELLKIEMLFKSLEQGNRYVLVEGEEDFATGRVKAKKITLYD